MTPRSDADFVPVLAEVEEHLDNSHALDTLARQSGYSPFHFHRRFVAAVGETPKQHVQRMRLERAAYLVAISDERFVQIAFTVGFQSHETFTRAFRRYFGTSPTVYRRTANAAQAERLVRNASYTGDGCILSAVQILTLPSKQLLSVRHWGAYAEVPLPPFGTDDRIWSPLAALAREANVAYEHTAWSICLDDPTVTPGPKQRLDACIPVEGAIPVDTPFKTIGFAGGRYAGIEHVGEHETIGQAYRQVADAIRRSASVTFSAGPLVQIFRHLDSNPQHHRTEVYFPVVSR